ncbi:DUF4878 domain-containing protein [Flavisolibacter ginsenosidimutans]|uniref:DUF4878 domain-containing protein n=1 Tax=Flavisolibacter ginsenosidimutans TaxID=661481 RepID=A0A5B8UGJ7_9BACT|nr:DUF4878 domain-containing protein [Flavisolibacter ginsenosidimutans]QEC55633.1 DUF4878 domain-containing protein [Flavisolibacter ginsenosidimutans]
MLKKIVFNTCLLLLVACNNDSESTSAAPPENDVDAARTFIRSALDGRWKDAKRLIVQDSINIGDLDATEQNYTQHMNVTDQRGYRESQIRIFDTRKQGDSISIVTYANTYKNQKDSIKVVKQNGAWLVDLKYSFPNNRQQ